LFWSLSYMSDCSGCAAADGGIQVCIVQAIV
jgi:hypothetical protein